MDRTQKDVRDSGYASRTNSSAEVVIQEAASRCDKRLKHQAKACKSEGARNTVSGQHCVEVDSTAASRGVKSYARLKHQEEGICLARTPHKG